MNICIVGWYGTETLGDRSILIGLAKVINDTYGKSKIYLGSLNMFYTERCIFEDSEFYKAIAPEVEIALFNVKNINEYKNIIKKSDMIAMGGGPIMDLNELGVIEFGFGYAKKNMIKTALLGCGLGPLSNIHFQKIAAHILSLSDLIIFRDRISANYSEVLALKYNREIKADIAYAHDPAIIPIGFFLKDSTNFEKENYLAMNLREFPVSVYKDFENNNYDEFFTTLLVDACQVYDKVVLVPMHTFFVGGDDRSYLSKIQQLSKCNNVTVIHKPTSVYELFKIIYCAANCIGMRYHSIVFQTLLNGNNAMLDYTEPSKGKISGFIDLVAGSEHYKNLYCDLHNSKIYNNSLIKNLKNTETFMFDDDIFNKTIYEYGRRMKEVL